VFNELNQIHIKLIQLYCTDISVKNIFKLLNVNTSQKNKFYVKMKQIFGCSSREEIVKITYDYNISCRANFNIKEKLVIEEKEKLEHKKNK
jgi:hypothetical protein